MYTEIPLRLFCFITLVHTDVLDFPLQVHLLCLLWHAPKYAILVLTYKSSWIHRSRLVWLLYRCPTLRRVVYIAFGAAKRLFENILKEKGIYTQVLDFCCEMSLNVESNGD